MNPEFKRNIWQELSLQRLIAMPAILLAIFFIVYLKSDQIAFSIPNAALNLLLILLVVWGSGLASDAIFQEMRERTWDAQRMTPLGPWSMTWGKIFGSTIFVWYGAFWCLVAIGIAFLSRNSDIGNVDIGKVYPNLFYTLCHYLLIGVFTQAFGLFTALLFQRISPLSSRARVVLIQFFAIAVGLIFFVIIQDASFEVFKVYSWYSLKVDYKYFSLFSLVFFCLSLFFGIYRLLRNELQMQSLPWAWPLFLILWIFYLEGFAYTQSTEIPRDYLHMVWIGIAYGIAIKGSFLAAFFSPKNIVQYFRWTKYIKQGRAIPAFSLTPPWIFSGIIALVLLFIFIYSLSRPNFPEPKVVPVFIGFAVTLFFFLLRDIGILYYITFDFHAKRAHLATIVYLVVLYTLVPILLSFTAVPQYLYPALAPWAWFSSESAVTITQILFISSLVLLQAIIAWGLVMTRWRTAARQLT